MFNGNHDAPRLAGRRPAPPLPLNDLEPSGAGPRPASKFCLGLLSVLLAGCSHPGSDKTLTIAVNAGVEGSALKAAAHEWGELRNTRIEVVELPYANLFEKESLDLASRTGAYDVIMLDDPWFPKLVADGGLTPLPRAPDADFLVSCLAVCRHPYLSD